MVTAHHAFQGHLAVSVIHVHLVENVLMLEGTITPAYAMSHALALQILMFWIETVIRVSCRENIHSFN